MYARNRKRIFHNHKRIDHEQRSDCHHRDIISYKDHDFCICLRNGVQVVRGRRISGRVRDRHSWRLGGRLLFPINSDHRSESVFREAFVPDINEIYWQTLISEGYNIFRLPFLMERMVPTTLTGEPDPGYLANMTAVVDYITSAGAYAVLDAHNYGRYYGNIITDTSGFEAFWKTLASQFADNALVIFDTNNEYHDMDQTLVLDLNQAAIDGIRAAGATSQYIFVEGNSYTGAWTWNVTNDNLKALTDPDNKIVYEMHQYLDTDGSGQPETCVSDTIGVERVEGATAWLRANGKLGVLGEFAGGPDTTCMAAIVGMLDHMEANSDVWLGALWWAAGPWWGNYTTYNFEPLSGTAYEYYDSTLVQYTPAHYVG